MSCHICDELQGKCLVFFLNRKDSHSKGYPLSVSRLLQCQSMCLLPFVFVLT